MKGRRSTLKMDLMSGQVSYRCKCRRIVRVHASDLAAGLVDYCGCGRLRIDLSQSEVKQHRQMAGLPELEE